MKHKRLIPMASASLLIATVAFAGITPAVMAICTQPHRTRRRIRWPAA